MAKKDGKGSHQKISKFILSIPLGLRSYYQELQDLPNLS